MAMKGEQVTIHKLEPAKTLQQALANAKSFVNEVHASAGNSSTQGAGATIVKGKGKN